MSALKLKIVRTHCACYAHGWLDIKEEEQVATLAELRGEYTKAEWGSQIRSYVLHPYQMVKDHRTDYEVGNAQAVLNGDIDGFIEAYLRSNLTNGK